MVAVIGEAGVRLRPETSGFSESASIGLIGPLKEVAGKGAEVFAAAWTAEHVFDYLKDSVKAYSDTTEATTRAQTVFGESFESVQKFAEGAARTMGQSTSQAIGSASTFGNLFRSMGVGTDESAKMSTGFVKLASDMASFNNVPIDQALGALQSGVTGMTRPLKQFGVNLDQATLSQEAARIKTQQHGEVTDQAAKAMAAYELIMKNTTLTQGDFTRTANNLANQQRIIAAESENLKDKVGSAIEPFVTLGERGISGMLLPALLKLATPLEKVGEGAKVINDDLAELTGSAKASFEGFNVAGDTWATRMGASVGRFTNQAQSYWRVFDDSAKGSTDWLDQAALPGWEGFVTRAGVALHGLTDDARSDFGLIRTHFTESMGPLRSDVATQFDAIKASIGQSLSGALSGLSGGGGGLANSLASMLNAAVPVITGLIDKVMGVVGPLIPTIGAALAGVVPIITGVVGQIGPILMQLIPAVEAISGIWRTVFLQTIQQLLPILPVIVGAIGQLIGTLASGLGPIISAIVPVIHQLVGIITQVAGQIVAALLPVLPVLINALETVGKTIINALLSVLQALLPVLPPIVAVVGQIAGALAGALGGALSALAPVLTTVINALLQLIMSALTPLLPILPMLAGLLVPVAQLLGALIQGLAPILPVVARIVGVLIQLIVVALQPLMPVISIVAGLLQILVAALVPVIGFGVQLVTVWVNIMGAWLGIVVGVISSVIGWFQHLLAEASGIFSRLGSAFAGAFNGVAGVVHAVFDGIVSAVKWYINTIIGIVNGAIRFIDSTVIHTLNHLPGVNIPDIPQIPTLHQGGVFLSGDSSGEGLAVLRDRELVVTPEQRSTAANLLASMTGATATTAAAALSGATGSGSVTVENYITQQPGESGTELAARATQGTVWALNNGITRSVGAPPGGPS